MRKLVTIIVSVLALSGCSEPKSSDNVVEQPATEEKEKINQTLKHELDSIYEIDQRYRKLSWLYDSGKGDSLAEAYDIPADKVESFLIKNMMEVDTANSKRIEEIFKEYGYPGKSLVGTPTNEAAFFVLQHSHKIKKYIHYVEQAAKNGELPFKHYAMMLDRSLMREGKEQLYGTQAHGFKTVDSVTGEEEWKYVIWPIEDAENVNERRKQAGFDITIEEHADKMGLEYQVLTLAELNKMKGV